jgi:hypothetical protein
VQLCAPLSGGCPQPTLSLGAPECGDRLLARRPGPAMRPRPVALDGADRRHYDQKPHHHGARRQVAGPPLVGSHYRQSDLRRTVGVALLVSRYPSRISPQSSGAMADCGEYRQAAGAFAKGYQTGHTYGPVKVPVENRWNSSGKLVVRAKIPVTCYLFGAAPKNAERVGLWIRPCPSNLSERFWAGPFSSSDPSFVRALQHAFRAIIRD